MMPRHRKLAIGTTLGIGFIFAALALYWQTHNSFSGAIRTKGPTACHMMPCIFHLGQVFPGDWDRVLIFNIGASQEEIDQASGHHNKKPDLQRLIVFMHGSNVVRTLTESEGFEHPIPAAVLFGGVPQTLNHQIVQRDWDFVMTRGGPDCEDCTTLSRVMPGEVME